MKFKVNGVNKVAHCLATSFSASNFAVIRESAILFAFFIIYTSFSQN
jgi:hypothetical protein